MKKSYEPNRHVNHVGPTLLCVAILALASTSIAQQTYTFTNCGATGSLGPTQTQVTNAYSLTNLAGSVNVTSTGIQTWTVPANGLYRVTAYGASGGRNSGSNAPGLGAIMQGDFTLNGGDVLQILVGQMGEDHPSYAAGGGGGTFVTKIPHNTIGSILVVAGGGGGASGDFPGVSAVTATCGTFDVQSGPGQCAGDGGISFTGNSGGGGGGFFNDGAGNSTVANGGKAYVNGGAGALTSNTYARGGFGGGGGNSSPATSTYASSGGGGFSGGNGGNRNSTQGTGRMGGGGGGSYNNGSNQLNSINTTTGHGKVLITELCNISIISSNNGTNTGMLCSGNTITLTTNAVSNYSWTTGSTASFIVVSPATSTVYGLTATSSSNCVASTNYSIAVSPGVPVLTVTTSTTQVCLGKTATLTASGALTYTWSHNVVNGASYTPSVTATYTVNGQNGCGTTSAVATISVGPLPVSITSNTAAVCSGGVATFTVTSAANSFTWMPQNSVSASSTIVVSPVASTVYTVTATDGTCSGMSTISLTAKPLPTISIAASATSICLGDAVSMTVSGAQSYTWTQALSGTSVVDSPTTATLYQVSGTNSVNCTSSANHLVLVDLPPTLSANLSSTLICKGASVVLSASGAQTYTWSHGGNTGSTTVSPVASTVYVVTGGQTTNSCVATRSYTVDVASLVLGVSASTTICDGAAVTLTAGPAANINWSHGLGGFTPVYVTPSVTTVYTVTGEVSTSSITCPATATVQVTVNANPTVTANASPTVMCKGESVSLNAGGASTYSWSTGQSGGVVTYTSNANNTTNFITVTGTDLNGCTGTATVTVKVNTCSGIHEVVNVVPFRVYPVPSNGEIVIESSAATFVTIINQLGQTVRVVGLDGENGFRVRIGDLPAGVYFVMANGFTTKIVIE